MLKARYCAVLILLLLVAFAPGSEAKEGATLSEVRLGVHPGHTRFVAELTQKVDYKISTHTDPYRVVVEIPGIAWQVSSTKTPHPHGLITAIRYERLVSAVVIELSGPAAIQGKQLIPADASHPWRLVIDLTESDPARFTSSATFAPETKATPPAVPKTVERQAPGPQLTSKTPERPKSSANPPPVSTDTRRVIVIDPGHGGIDPGAQGADGTKEKDVVFKLAKALAEKLNALGRYHAVLTRESDTYLKLSERLTFARAAKANLFISFHADSLPGHDDVQGLSVYTLSDKASDREAEAFAKRENRADIIAGVDLSSENQDVSRILIDLASRETMARSARVARAIAASLASVAPLTKNPSRRAGFKVLKNPDVPSVLIELGYLSNSTDLVRLTSEDWQVKAVDVLVTVIDQDFIQRPEGYASASALSPRERR